MAGIMDKLKGLLGRKGSGGASTGGIKEQAGEVKDKVDELVDKAGDKVPDAVKDVYEKVSDKVEEIIPGQQDADAGDGSPAAADKPT